MFPLKVNKQSSKFPLRLNTKNIQSMIPLNLYQTWYTLDLPPKMKENLELLKQQNPEFKHYLYDDAMCRNFIQQNFDADVLYSFDKLKPGAYKADLWRYCIIYEYGGIYADSDTVLVDNPMIFMNTTAKLLVVPENDVHMCQWVFSEPKDSPILE